MVHYINIYIKGSHVLVKIVFSFSEDCFVLANSVDEISKSSLVRVLLVCFSDKLFCVNSSLLTNILFENRKRKVFKTLEHLLYSDNYFLDFSTYSSKYDMV